MTARSDAPSDAEIAHTYHGRPFRDPLPIVTTIIDHVERQAASRGDQPFVTAVGTAGDHVETLTYGALAARSAAVASWLRTELGVAPGDVVGVLPVNDIPSVLALIGVLRAGCAAIVANPADPPARVRDQLDAAGAAAVVCSPAVDPDTSLGAVAVGEKHDHDDGTTVSRAADPYGDALLFGTSGSTARSKLVAQSHYGAAVNASALIRHHRLRPGEVVLGCLPIHHVNGVHLTLFATLAAGAHAVLAARFEPFGYPTLIERFRPRIAGVVPSILEALTASWRDAVLPPAFDYFVSAAAPLASTTARAVHDALRARVVQGYGLTETINFSTTMPIDLDDDAYRRLVLEREIPPVGVELFGNEVAVLLPDGTPAPAGEPGEVCMRGHNVMLRYHGNDEATAEAFRHGWFHSGDLGYELVDEPTGHRLFVLTGRSKNIAKVRGESVSLDEMDRALRALPYVADAACVAVPDRFLGEEVVAALVLTAPATDDEVRAALAATFAAAVLPRRIVRLDRVPRTPTGKVRRPDLAAQLAPGAGTGNSASQ